MSTSSQVAAAVEEFWVLESEGVFEGVRPGDALANLPAHLVPPPEMLYPLLLTPAQYIYRARPAEAAWMAGDRRCLVRNYKYAPPEFSNAGRANFRGEPMFYGSEYISATALESRLRVEEDSLIGCWRVQPGAPDLRLALLATTFHPPVAVDIGSKLPTPLLLQLKFLEDIFCTDRERPVLRETGGNAANPAEPSSSRLHVVTAAIAKHIVSAGGHDGVAYRSAQAQGVEAILAPHDEADFLLNVAITKPYVDENLVLECVYLVRIDSYDDDRGGRRAKRSALEIGLPIDELHLEFRSLTDSEALHFEVVHNQSSVPFLLPSPVYLSIKGPTDSKPFFEAAAAAECPKHQTTAKVTHRVESGSGIIEIATCCDAQAEIVQAALRPQQLWVD